MKRIDAFISRTNLDDMRAALHRVGVDSLILRDAHSVGRTPPRKEVYRGSAYLQEATEQVEVTAFIEDFSLNPALAAIEGSVHESEIFVSSVERRAGH
jgi:nitrogen regulatory protein PII